MITNLDGYRNFLEPSLPLPLLCPYCNESVPSKSSTEWDTFIDQTFMAYFKANLHHVKIHPQCSCFSFTISFLPHLIIGLRELPRAVLPEHFHRIFTLKAEELGYFRW